MPWYQTVFGAVLVVVLFGLSIYFGRLQLLELRKLRGMMDSLPDEEWRYQRRKALRRLISSALLFVLGVLLVVLLGYEQPAQVIADERRELPPATPFTDAQVEFLRTWGWTWISFLMVLLAVIVLAGIDLMSTRWYALRHFRKLHADRRAMIEREAQRIRQKRNGFG